MTRLAEIPDEVVELASEASWNSELPKFWIDEERHEAGPIPVWKDAPEEDREPYRISTRAALLAALPHLISALRLAGWTAPEEIALLIKAAGGEIVITRTLREELGRDWRIERWDEPRTDSTVIRVAINAPVVRSAAKP